jgi:phosphoglycolate phosphatase-like HAD superfamily hydrolase
MKKPIIYALDFDGVICDSALETGISAWKAGSHIWGDFSSSMPTAEQSAQFRQIRPIMGTGYEAILIVRLLNNGETVEEIMADYHAKTQKVIKDSALTVGFLKKIFGETRDRWIEEDLDDWVAMNPLFPGIAEKLQSLSEQGLWYIITTKQERFVKQILKANQVELSEERIFGLDRNMSKEAVLIDLVNKHAGQQIYFTEDMLPTLLKIIKNSQLESVKLFFALWGYNTAQDKVEVGKQEIESIDIDSFLQF